MTTASPATAAPDRREGVARGTATVLLTYVGTAGFTALLTLYLVRALGPADFGVFSLAMSISGLVAFPADLGIAASATRFMAEHQGDSRAQAALFAVATRLKLLVAGAVAIVVAVLADPIADAYHQPALAWPLRAMAVATLAQSTVGLFSGIFIAVGRTAVNLRLIVGESAVELTASIALVAAGGGAGGAALGRAIGYVAGAMLGLALAVRLFGRGAAAFHRRGGRRMATMGRYALTVWIVNGAYLLFTQLDVLLIGAILNAAAVGAFSAPVRLTLLLGYPGLAVANVVSPLVARREGSEPDHAAVQHAFRALVIIQAAMVPPLLVWAGPIVRLLLGSDYGSSVGVLRAMTPFIFLQGLASLVSLTVNYVGEARRRLPFAVGAVVINVAIDLALLKTLGVIAAAIGTSVAYAFYVGGHVALSRRLFGLRLLPLALTAARCAVAGAAMAGVLALFGTADLSPVAWVAGLVCGTLTFAAVVLVTREVTPAELAAGRRWLAARRG